MTNITKFLHFQESFSLNELIYIYIFSLMNETFSLSYATRKIYPTLY